MKKRLLGVFLTLAVVFGVASVASAGTISIDISFDVAPYGLVGYLDTGNHMLYRSSDHFFLTSVDSFDYAKLQNDEDAPAPRGTTQWANVLSGEDYHKEIFYRVTSLDADNSYHVVFTLASIYGVSFDGLIGAAASLSTDFLAATAYTVDTLPSKYNNAVIQLGSASGIPLKTPLSGGWKNDQLSFDVKILSAEQVSFDLSFVVWVSDDNISAEYGGYVRVNPILSIDEAAATTPTAFTSATFTVTPEGGEAFAFTVYATDESKTQEVKLPEGTTSVTIAVQSDSEVTSAKVDDKEITSDSDGAYPVNIVTDSVPVVFTMANGDGDPVVVTIMLITQGGSGENPGSDEPENVATVTINGSSLTIKDDELVESITASNVAEELVETVKTTITASPTNISIAATGANLIAAYKVDDGKPTEIEDELDDTAFNVEADKTYYAVYEVDAKESPNQFAVGIATALDNSGTPNEPDPGNTSSSGSSSGCDAGLGALALLAVVPFVKKIRK